MATGLRPMRSTSTPANKPNATPNANALCKTLCMYDDARLPHESAEESSRSTWESVLEMASLTLVSPPVY